MSLEENISSLPVELKHMIYSQWLICRRIPQELKEDICIAWSERQQRLIRRTFIYEGLDRAKVLLDECINAVSERQDLCDSIKEFIVFKYRKGAFFNLMNTLLLLKDFPEYDFAHIRVQACLRR
jgi:hypothetical protein